MDNEVERREDIGVFAMKKPARIVTPRLSATEREALAERAVYVGSVEHKEKRSWLGLPRPRRNLRADPDDHRQNATICPLVRDEDKERATGWVRDAIRNSQYDAKIWDGEFPRNVWYQDAQGKFWQGRGNSRGEYKGWPISEEERNENFD